MNFSFSKKMMVFILLPIILVLVIMTYFSYSKARTALSETINKQLTTMVKIQGEGIYSNMLLYRAITEEISQDNAIVSYLEAKDSNVQEKVQYYDSVANNRMKRVESNFSGISELILLDTQFVCVAGTSQENLGKNFSGQEIVKNAVGGQESHTMIKGRSGSLDFAICYPVFTESKSKIVGYIITVINLEHITKRTIDNVNFSATGTAAVFDQNGTFVMHKNRDAVGQNKKDSEEFREVQRVKTGFIRYSYQGRTRVAFIYEIKWLNWYLTFPVWEDDIFSGVTELYNNTIIICLVSLAILLTIILLFSKRVSFVLGGIEKISSKVAAGDLQLSDRENQQLQEFSRRKDEIGGLSDSFSKMIVALLQTIQEAKNAYKEGMNEAAEKLQSVTEATSAATHELSAQIQESSNGSDMQAQRISETVTAVEEMNATILEVTKNTVTTAKIANDTREKAEQGESVVKEFMQSIGKVEKSTSTLKSDMDELNKHVQNINQIMAVISDLADQTNLLALNAAIEAARAGEAGRGFAVVADEVRKLAEKTMSSTTNVGNAVVAIKNSTSSSLEQVELTVELVNTAISLAEQCRQVLTEIVDMASDSAERIGSIAVASEEQSATSEEITRTINDINGVVMQTSATMNEAKNAIIEISRQGEIINNMIKGMRS